MTSLVTIACLLTLGGFFLGPNTDSDKATTCLTFSIAEGVAWVVWAASYFYSQVIA